MTPIHNNSVVTDERSIYSTYRAGRLPALWQALQADMNPNGVTSLSRWIAALLLIDLSHEVEHQECVTVAAELAELACMAPAQLLALADVIDDIGALVYEWREENPLSVALDAVRGAA